MLSHIALKSGNNDLALQWLAEAEQRGELTVIPQLALMFGTAKLHHLESDANVPLQLFLSTYKGQNYRKEALQKLAWFDLIQGNSAGYSAYMARCRLEGCELAESDHYAMEEAIGSQMPHPQLLKARLLFDGGYYLDALESIEQVSFDELTGIQQVEYRYRSGRIFQELGREYDALFSYKMTISSGKEAKEYYACAAAFYTGVLYEQKNDPENAMLYFQMCLNMSPESYRSGLHQKAKAGMSRLKGG